MRYALLVAALLILPLQAATATILPEQVRGSLSFGHVGDASPTPVHVNAGTPANSGNYDFTITSSVWPTTPGLTMRVVIEKSFDGGASWSFLMGNSPSDPTDHFISNVPSKDGTGLAKFGTRWNGEAMDIRGTFVPNVSFSWGVSAAF